MLVDELSKSLPLETYSQSIDISSSIGKIFITQSFNAYLYPCEATYLLPIPENFSLVSLRTERFNSTFETKIIEPKVDLPIFNPLNNLNLSTSTYLKIHIGTVSPKEILKFEIIFLGHLKTIKGLYIEVTIPMCFFKNLNSKNNLKLTSRVEINTLNKIKDIDSNIPYIWSENSNKTRKTGVLTEVINLQKDFKLVYENPDNKEVMLVYQACDEGYCGMISYNPKCIEEAKDQFFEYWLVVDSKWWFAMKNKDYTLEIKKACKLFLASLKPGDYFNFIGPCWEEFCAFDAPVIYNSKNTKNAKNKIENLQFHYANQGKVLENLIEIITKNPPSNDLKRKVLFLLYEDDASAKQSVDGLFKIRSSLNFVGFANLNSPTILSQSCEHFLNCKIFNLSQNPDLMQIVFEFFKCGLKRTVSDWKVDIEDDIFPPNDYFAKKPYRKPINQAIFSKANPESLKIKASFINSKGEKIKIIVKTVKMDSKEMFKVYCTEKAEFLQKAGNDPKDFFIEESLKHQYFSPLTQIQLSSNNEGQNIFYGEICQNSSSQENLKKILTENAPKLSLNIHNIITLPNKSENSREKIISGLSRYAGALHKYIIKCKKQENFFSLMNTSGIWTWRSVVNDFPSVMIFALKINKKLGDDILASLFMISLAELSFDNLDMDAKDKIDSAKKIMANKKVNEKLLDLSSDVVQTCFCSSNCLYNAFRNSPPSDSAQLMYAELVLILKMFKGNYWEYKTMVLLYSDIEYFSSILSEKTDDKNVACTFFVLLLLEKKFSSLNLDWEPYENLAKAWISKKGVDMEEYTFDFSIPPPKNSELSDLCQDFVNLQEPKGYWRFKKLKIKFGVLVNFKDYLLKKVQYENAISTLFALYYIKTFLSSQAHYLTQVIEKANFWLLSLENKITYTEYEHFFYNKPSFLKYSFSEKQSPAYQTDHLMLILNLYVKSHWEYETITLLFPKAKNYYENVHISLHKDAYITIVIINLLNQYYGKKKQQ